MPPRKRRSKRPNWPEGTLSASDAIVNEFKKNLTTISETLARQESALNVDPRHVDDAFKTLDRLGMRRQVWWKRTELEVGVGASLFSLGLASPDVLTTLLGNDSPTTKAVMVGLMVVGSAVAIHGWFRGRI